MEKSTITTVIVICALGIILSLININIPGPADWLLSWTSWIGSVVGIVVAARVLWKASSLIQHFLSK